MKQPENKKEMQTFLGMVQYLQKFIPHLSVLAEPLRDLIKTNLPYVWGQNINCNESNPRRDGTSTHPEVL